MNIPRLPVKKISLPLVLVPALLFSPEVTLAKTQYVRPSDEIPIRRGIGTEFKIITFVKEGASLEVIEEQKGWTKVQLENGKQGWMLKRYLDDTPPPYEQIALLTTQKEQLTAQAALLQAELEKVTESQEQTTQKLAACITERNEINKLYKTLQRDTIDVVQTKEDLAAARKRIDQLEKEYSGMKVANSVLKKNEAIKWFLSGSGVILLGWILGRFSSSPKKQKSSLLS
ncbi:MAG: hypothetical protein CSA32_05760 [Desulfobulbus propionicus]|nr:MAG: hypothetical protein CSA32_05760 [Desulfobulbus propionicus]